MKFSIYFLMMLSGAALFFSCASIRSRTPNSTQALYYALTPDEQNCLSKIKNSMANQAFRFANVKDLEIQKAIDEVNNDTAYKQNLIFLSTFDNGKTFPEHLNTQTAFKWGEHSKIGNVELSLSSEGSFLFDLSLSAEQTIVQRPKQKNMTLSQTFSVNSSCELVVNSVGFFRTNFDGEKVNFVSKTLKVNGSTEIPEVKAKTFLRPVKGSFLYGSIEKADGPWVKKVLKENSNGNFFQPFSTETPWVELQVSESSPLVAPNGEMLSGSHGNILVEGHQIYSGDFYSGSSGIFRKGDTSFTMQLSQDDWMNSFFIKGNKSGSINVEVAPDAVLSASPLKIRIESAIELNYPNLGAYWKVESRQMSDDPENKTPYSIVMTSRPKLKESKSAPPVENPQETGRPFLSESEFIEINHPDVQALLGKIRLRITKGMSRAQIVKEIVGFLSEVLTYDDHMIDDGEYRFSMKTSEILQRKKVVCQQYINVFTALARGLGVPARSIVGLDLFGQASAGFHAWNEYEIREGVWVPLEPQNPHTDFDPAHYVPFLVQGYEKLRFRPAISKRYMYAEKYKIKILKSGPDLH